MSRDDRNGVETPTVEAPALVVEPMGDDERDAEKL